jgi:hypothetical protein
LPDGNKKIPLQWRWDFLSVEIIDLFLCRSSTAKMDLETDVQTKMVEPVISTTCVSVSTL